MGRRDADDASPASTEADVVVNPALARRRGACEGTRGTGGSGTSGTDAASASTRERSWDDASSAEGEASHGRSVSDGFEGFASRTSEEPREDDAASDGRGVRRVSSWFLERDDSGRGEKKTKRRPSWSMSKTQAAASAAPEEPRRASNAASAKTLLAASSQPHTPRSDTFGSKRLQEEDERVWRFILCHPASPHARAITRSVNLLILVVAFIEPASLAFRNERREVVSNYQWIDVIEILFSIVFCVDICMNFFRPLEKYGKLVWDMKKIAKEYLRGWFVLDFLSSLPFDLMFISKTHDSRDLSRVIAGLGLLRLLRMYRVRRMMSEFERNSNLPYLVLLSIKFALLIGLAAHWSACLLYYIARIQEFNENTWVYAVDPELPNMAFYDVYTTALYWSVVTLTTVGYGDISPVSTSERAVAMVVMIMNMGVTAYILGNVTQLVTKEDATIMAFRDHSGALQRFMRRNDIPDAVRQKVDAHIQLEFEMGCRDDENVLNFCPSTIQSELRHALYQQYVQESPIFREVSPVFIQYFLECITVEYFLPGTLLTCEGLDATAMFYLCLGKVDIVSEDYLTNSTLANKIETVFPGEWLNIAAVLCGKTCFHTSVVQSTCKLLVVSTNKLQNVLRRFPMDTKHIMKDLLIQYRDEMKEYRSQDRRGSLYAAFINALETKRSELNEVELHQLTVACVTGDVADLDMALNDNPQSVHLTDAAGRTLLMTAVENKQKEVVKLLLRRGADPNTLSKAGFSALSRAVSVASLELVRLLVSAGGVFTEPGEQVSVHNAIAQGQIQHLKLLVEAGVCLHNQDYNGSTGLHVAARTGSNAAIEILHRAGLEDTFVDKDGRTALDVAEISGNPGSVKLLKDMQISSNTKSEPRED